MPKSRRNTSHGGRTSGGGANKMKRYEIVHQEIEGLNKRIAEGTPNRGFAPPLHQQVAFRSLPISATTLRGLEDVCGYTTMTAIQHACIPHALAGRDILGAARTGSGKTVAFLVPLLERLYRDKHNVGCGAIVLSPTRELAVQIFGVLRKLGSHHTTLKAGLLVGGGKKEFSLEQQHVGQMHILVATPGRLLQHLEQTPDLDVTSHLSVLVLDEADRILDMGFRPQVQRILDSLSTHTEDRQTMLFSATQTRKVSDLARLSLSQPEYLGVHDKETSVTPETLQQSLVVVPLEHKLNAIYSFVKSHLKCKTIIFLASCSQVRHAWELFCALQPGIPIMALHGKLVQEKRTQVYMDFSSEKKPHAVLFATDVASRGLDFRGVHWVVQADAPEDVDMYIHRAGRTARYKAGGKALLFCTPQEEKGFQQVLQERKIPITKLSINPTKTVLVTQKAAGLVASRPTLKELAKKAFKSYVRSIHLQPNAKSLFPSVWDLELDEYATSLGLASAPKLGFLKTAPSSRTELREKKNVNHKLNRLKEQIKAEKLAKRIAKLGGAATALEDDGEKNQAKKKDDNDDLLVFKRKHKPDEDSDDEDLPDSGLYQVTKARKTKKIRIGEGGTGANTRIHFNEDGEEADGTIMAVADAVDRDTLESSHDDYMRKVRERLAATKDEDLADAKERVREKHRKKRNNEKVTQKYGDDDDDDEEVVVTLGNADGGSASSSGSDDNSDDSSGSDDDSSDDESVVDIKAQEELALRMIRGS
jgi:ATP-dependent RNA helicase DDX10/DBP4